MLIKQTNSSITRFLDLLTFLDSTDSTDCYLNFWDWDNKHSISSSSFRCVLFLY